MPQAIATALADFSFKKFLIHTIVSYGIGRIIQSITKPTLPEFRGQGLKMNNTSKMHPIPVVYGRRRMGGSEYRSVKDLDETGDNKSLYRVLVLCEGQIDSIEEVYLNDRTKSHADVAPLYSEEIKTGQQNQTVSSLALSNVDGWQTNFTGKGLAYIVVRLDFDEDVFASGLPVLNADVKGKKLYDPRKDSSLAGGDMAFQTVFDIQSIANTSTITTSMNDFVGAYTSGNPSTNSGVYQLWLRGIASATPSHTVTGNILSMTATRTSGSGGFGAYFRIKGLKTSTQYKFSAEARVVENTTGQPVRIRVDLSDGNQGTEFQINEPTNTTTSTWKTITATGEYDNTFSGNIDGTHNFLDVGMGSYSISGTPSGTMTVEFKNLVFEELVPPSGSHVFTDETTYEWSENPALCILDYLTNTTYGRGVPITDIDLVSFMTEANYCDDVITLKDSAGNDVPNQKRYTCNGFLNPDESSLDNLKRLLTSCRGVLIPPSDKFVLKIDKPETSVFTFDKTNIVGNWQIAGRGVRQRKNKVVSTFFDKNNKHDQTFSVTSSTGTRDFKADDNDRELTADLEYAFTDDLVRVDLLSQHYLKQSRLNWTVSFTATMQAIGVEAMDVVKIDHPHLGWSSGELGEGKLFRVTQVEITAEDQIKITAEEYDSSVYTFDVNTPPINPSTNLPDPTSAPPPSNLSLDSTKFLVGQSGTIIERIDATWNKPALGYVVAYEIAYKALEDANFTIIRSNDTKFTISPVSSAGAVSQTQVVVSGQYFVKVRAIYPSGRKSAFFPDDNGLFHQVTGKTANPNPPTNFIYEQSREFTRQFFYDQSPDLDIKGYKIKYSSTLSTAYADMIPLHTGFINHSPYETGSLSAGTYKFSIKAIDTSGNESSEVTINATVTDNPELDILQSYFPRLLGWTTVGSISGGTVDALSGDIDSTAGSNAEWQDLGTTTWDNWNEWGFASETLTYSTNGFEFGTDLTFTPIVNSTGVGTITHVIKTVPITSSASSPFSASDYTETYTSGVIDAKAIRTEVTVTGVNATLISHSILLDGKTVVEDIVDLDTSTISGSFDLGAGHIKIPLSQTFNKINSITVSFVGGGHSRTYEIVSKTSTVGSALAPTIKLYNGTSLADATIDITIKGF